MLDDDQLMRLPPTFDGLVRLFPLPNLVVFPHVIQPLHVFEPRYRALVEAALEGDQLITMALLKSGWEADYEGHPPLEPAVCVGRIVRHARLPDGCFNLMLLGVRRARLRQELPPVGRYRQAHVDLLPDRQPAAAAATLHDRLMAALRDYYPPTAALQEQLQQLSGSASLGMLTDLFAYMLPLELADKQQLLGDPDAESRGRHLLRWLEQRDTGLGAAEDFPPPFSLN